MIYSFLCFFSKLFFNLSSRPASFDLKTSPVVLRKSTASKSFSFSGSKKESSSVAVTSNAPVDLPICFIASTPVGIDPCRKPAVLEKTKTFLVNSGAEAVENAIKIARYATGKEKIIAFKGGFHGRTYLAMGLTGKEKPYKEGFGPFPKFITHVDYPYHYRDISDEKVLKQIENTLLKKLDPNNVAAIVIEIQLGEGGYIPATEKFLKQLRKVAEQHNILLIFDEVQTGFGRTGEMFGADKINVQPDMVTLAKGIGGGFPLAAVVGKAEIMDSVHDAGIGSTFGASPISCAAALGVLDVFDKDSLLEKVNKQTKIMDKSLGNINDNFDFVGDVRGYGIMKGVEIVESKDNKIPSKDLAMRIINNSKKNGLLLVNCGKEGNVIRFMGPLTTPLTQIREAMEMFNQALEKV